jgi:uncharacterized protein (DUF305 family)
MKTFISTIAAILLAAASGAACRSAGGVPASQAAERPPEIIQPGAPGESSRVVTAAQASDLSKVQHTAADVKFMQGMIGHHAQAVEMVELLNQNTTNPDMKLLGLRIKMSQDDEMNMMRRWLADHGAAIPGPHSHHEPGGFMPGMLTSEEMAQLAAAKDKEFDRLFLRGMIKHHGGAIQMVQELFATPGAGQEGGIYAFATDVDSDQRMEIDRMGMMLKEIEK